MHFKVHSRFFYSRLSDGEKKIYDKILQGWLDYNETVTVTGMGMSVDYTGIFRCLKEDNPELFYVDFNRVSVMYTPFMATVSMKLLYPRDRCEQLKSRIASVVMKVHMLSTASKDRERAIHDYLVQNVRYASDTSARDAHSVVGALVDGIAVCEGYAKAFKLLCDAVEVPCIIVSGTATNSDGVTENHAWNIVRKNKKNYHVDVTWDSGIHNSVDGLPLYYNLPDEYIARDHFWQRDKWPCCRDSSEADKIVIPVNSKKSFSDVIVNMSRQGKTVFAVRFNRSFESMDAVLAMVGDIVAASRIRVRTYSVSYKPGSDCASVWLNY
ncbi:MAG: hypothetical protein IKZ19_02670 [Clostridia bacterium]|nr:hypothetical protein [Clostridia bacterium]